MDEKSISIPLVRRTDEVRTLKDIQVPEKFFRRMKMEVQILDELFGGQDFPGTLPGTSILFTGMPGAGKSTAALQFADLLQRNSGRNILYNVGEESEFMVALRSLRLGLTADFGISTMDDVDDLIRVCRDTGVEVLFQDSLQTLSSKDTALMSRMERMKVITKRLHRFAKDEDVTIWIIGHITKGGDFAGPMELKHELDVHAHIRLNPETMAREFMLTKNRFGPAGIPYECNLTGKGLDFAAMALVENGQEAGKPGGKAAERREAHERIIKEALLKGDQISAYCQGRFDDPFTKKKGIDCSPGVWRSTLEKVVSTLQAEGHVVGVVLKDGRKHYRVEI